MPARRASLGALIVLTDGADNSDWTPSQGLDFGSRDIPIFTVGIGQEQIPRTSASLM